MINFKSVKKYCCEDISLIENYGQAVNDKSQIWSVHHRLEVQNDIVISARQLIEMKLYYERPASELIFLTKSEHSRLHALSSSNRGKNNPMYGKHHSEETKQKLSESNKGKHNNSGENNPFYGKHHSEETKTKISIANSGLNHSFYGKHFSEEHKSKLSQSNKGKHNTAGEKNGFYGKHHSEETRQKMKDAWVRRKNISNSKSNSYVLF